MVVHMNEHQQKYEKNCCTKILEINSVHSHLNDSIIIYTALNMHYQIQLGAIFARIA